MLERKVLDQYGDIAVLRAVLVSDVEDHLRRLARFVPSAGGTLPHDPDIRALAHHYLWRACQGVLDLARLMAREARAVLPPELAARGRALVGLR